MKPKSWFFEKNQQDRKTEREYPDKQNQNCKGDITRDTEEIQRVIRSSNMCTPQNWQI